MSGDSLVLILADGMLLKEIALVFFVGFWLILLGRLVFTRADRYGRVARLPLDDETSPLTAGATRTAHRTENRSGDHG